MAGPQPNDATETLAERYSRRASLYRELWAPFLHPASARLIARLAAEPAPVSSAVDLATGVGTSLPLLGDAFPNASILGVDFSKGMLAEVPSGFRTAAMDARALSLPGRSVDLVHCAFMLFHLDRPLDVIREAARILRSGGRMSVATWAEIDRICEADEVLARCLDETGVPEVPPALPVFHELVDTPDKMRGLLIGGGFADVESWTDEIRTSLDRPSYLRLRMEMGPDIDRVHALGPEARADFWAAAERRLERLPDGAFEFRAGIVLSVGRVRH